MCLFVCLYDDSLPLLLSVGRLLLDFTITIQAICVNIGEMVTQKLRLRGQRGTVPPKYEMWGRAAYIPR